MSKLAIVKIVAFYELLNEISHLTQHAAPTSLYTAFCCIVIVTTFTATKASTCAAAADVPKACAVNQTVDCVHSNCVIVDSVLIGCGSTSNLEIIFVRDQLQFDIAYVTPHAFEPLYTTHLLTEMMIQGMSLTVVEANVFNGLTSISKLYLWKNQITHVALGAFDGMTSLSHLDFEGNFITNIPPGTFSGLPLLRSLYLSYNFITTICYGVFADLPKLQYLDLSSN